VNLRLAAREREWKIIIYHFKKPIRRNSVFVRYFISAFIVFILPFVVFGFFTFNGAVRKLNDEVQSSHVYRLKKIADDLDLQFENINVNSVKISLDNDLKLYKLNNNPYNEIEAIQDLQRYKENVLIADELIVYFKGSDSIYTSNCKYLNDIYVQDAIIYNKWNNIMEDLNKCERPFVRNKEPLIINRNEQNEVVTFVCTVSTYNTSNKDAVIRNIWEQGSRSI